MSTAPSYELLPATLSTSFLACSVREFLNSARGVGGTPAEAEPERLEPRGRRAKCQGGRDPSHLHPCCGEFQSRATMLCEWTCHLTLTRSTISSESSVFRNLRWTVDLCQGRQQWLLRLHRPWLPSYRGVKQSIRDTEATDSEVSLF